MDEASKQLMRDTREPLPIEPSKPEREEYDYERGGLANLFLLCEPLMGKRWVDVTKHRRRWTGRTRSSSWWTSGIRKPSG
ncbi:MAG: hypothetical protein M3Q29_08890 [Chloroflexota bacterium]|nr:hypothetical protein [Chloroflexota bacterium]